MPGLLGLSRDYLNGQLGAWRSGQRRAGARLHARGGARLAGGRHAGELDAVEVLRLRSAAAAH